MESGGYDGAESLKRLKADICAIGGGSGGRTVAYSASQLGASTVLIEKEKMGGDCLHYACVPSKALLAAGQAADSVRRADAFGVITGSLSIDPKRVYRHVHDTIATIEPNDSAEHYEELGVKVILAPARFVSPREVEADGYRISAKRFVIATGSKPQIPPIIGIDKTPFYTNETVFNEELICEHLIVIGGGASGVEMAQAHRHLGVKVTLLEKQTIMPNDDPELVNVLRNRFLKEGIIIHEEVDVHRVEKFGNGVAALFCENGTERQVNGSHIFVATGRRPDVEELGLENAGISFDESGIQVDSRLRTTNRRIFAVGDVTGGPQFSHMSVHQAHVVICNALFRLPVKVNMRTVPSVIYTAPELAQVGLIENEARERHGQVRVLRWPYSKNDRARAERLTDGLIKVIATPRGRILGAGIVGPHAGEVIQKWVMAMSEGINIRSVARMIAPYPTIGYSDRKVAGTFFTPMLFSKQVKKIVRLLGYFS